MYKVVFPCLNLFNNYHLFQLGQACWIFICENQLCCIAALIVSFIRFTSFHGINFTNVHHAVSIRFIGCSGGKLFPSGVDFVFTQIGVVAEACHVVNA
nr:hypothetical protein [bacterium]